MGTQLFFFISMISTCASVVGVIALARWASSREFQASGYWWLNADSAQRQAPHDEEPMPKPSDPATPRQRLARADVAASTTLIHVLETPLLPKIQHVKLKQLPPFHLAAVRLVVRSAH